MKLLKSIAQVLLYLFVFLMVETLVTAVVTAINYYLQGVGASQLGTLWSEGKLLPDSDGLIVISVVSSLVTLGVFLLARWFRPTRDYIRSRPWGVVFWVVILTLGTIIPSEYLQEQIPFDMPDEMKALLGDMMHNRWGYLAIGILAPLVEEVVFRGAILGVLLTLFGRRWHWVPIAISALIFGAAHGNVPQFVHATILGLLLGWMFYRTDSIVPGVVLHWVNNSAAYLIANLIPNSEDAALIDIFSGDSRAVLMALGFSCCLILPALFQLALRMKKAA